MLSSHSIVSSSRTVRPCSPWGGRWIWHCRTTWSTVYSSAPHSQEAEEAILHWCKRKRLSRTHAVLGRVIPGGWVPVSGMNMRSLVRLSNHSAFHRLSASARLTYVIELSDELMELLSDGYKWVSRFERPCIRTRWPVRAKWSRCSGSMPRRARDSVAPLRRSSAGWMPTRLGRLSAGVGRRHSLTIRRRWWQS